MVWGDYLTFEYGKPVSDKNATDGDVPVYGTNGQIGTSHLPPLCKIPSFIVGRKGAYRGVHYSEKPFSVIDTAFYAMPLSDKVNLKWAYYKFLTYDINRMDSGSAIPSTDRYELYKIPIDLPNLETQRRVVKLLDVFEKKMLINQQINDNLAEQIRTLCNAWLNDYEPFGEECPNDWELTPLSSFAQFISGYSYKGAELQDSSIAMATIKNFDRKGGFKLDGYKEIVPSSKLKPEHHANLFDTLVAHTDLTQNAEVIGNAEPILSFSGYQDIIFSMDVVKVLPNHPQVSQFLIAALLQTHQFKSHCLGYVNGTTVLHLSKKALPDYSLMMPKDFSILKPLDDTVSVMYQKMASNIDENVHLTTLRDSLLPRLMSGELDISGLDI